VPPAERIATFDNDGTLWIEQPMYVQLAFVLDRVKAMAPMHPEWKHQQPFAAVLDGDMKAVVDSGEKGLVELIAVTHAGMTTAEFDKIVTDWFATARDDEGQRGYRSRRCADLGHRIRAQHRRMAERRSFIGSGAKRVRLWLYSTRLFSQIKAEFPELAPDIHPNVSDIYRKKGKTQAAFAPPA
jgi:hypothetical protein